MVEQMVEGMLVKVENSKVDEDIDFQKSIVDGLFLYWPFFGS